jgi:hypothetical protein
MAVPLQQHHEAMLLQIDGRDENADYIFIVSLKFFSLIAFSLCFFLLLLLLKLPTLYVPSWEFDKRISVYE